MTDLVSRLRERHSFLCDEAAEEIERLRGALQQIVDAEGFDVNAAHFRQLALTALAGAAVQSDLARGCHRSHPHDDMDAGCERLTELAREANRAANQPTTRRHRVW